MKLKNKKSTTLDKSHIIALLRTHKPHLKRKFGVTKIALFGSYARDEQKKTSDIDLLIETKEHDFFNRYDLKEFLEEKLNKPVDIGYFSSLKASVMRNTEKGYRQTDAGKALGVDPKNIPYWMKCYAPNESEQVLDGIYHKLFFIFEKVAQRGLGRIKFALSSH